MFFQVFQLFLTKGTRYKIRIAKNKVPFTRKIGTLFLDPIARSALNYRGLSDVTNGFLGMDSNTAKFLIYSKISDIEPRYLFESSLLAKCSELEIGLNDADDEDFFGIQDLPVPKRDLQSSKNLFITYKREPYQHQMEGN